MRKRRLCARDGCGAAIPSTRNRSAIYCSEQCNELAKRAARQSRAIPKQERAYALLDRLASAGATAPPSMDELGARIGSSRGAFLNLLTKLVAAGKLQILGPRRARSYRLMVGPYAGHVLEPSGGTSDAGCSQRLCPWCECVITKRGMDGEINSYCSADHARHYAQHRASKRVIDARRAHLARQPKGCMTLDEFFASGGAIYHEPPVAAPISAAVCERGSALLGGRVR